MKAALVEKYGAPDVVRIAEVPTPIPRPNQAMIRVDAVALTSADSRIRGARLPPGFNILARLGFGITKPRRPILGSSFSGVIEAVGSKVNDFAPGDEVCGMTGLKMGAHAAFVSVSAEKLARKPTTVSHDDAAGLLFGGSAALFFLRDKASVAPGMSVLVNGASGSIGTTAIQLAKHFGATVTGVTSTANSDLVTQLGADHIIDYTTDDLAATVNRYDVVLDTVGNLSVPASRALLTSDGVALLAVAGLADLLRARGNVKAGTAPERVESFDFLLQLVAAGTIRVVHDQSYDLVDIVDAYRRVDSGRKVGNIVMHP